jgi:X-X-X-Leu-X-X-Gly heptad repeat protein
VSIDHDDGDDEGDKGGGRAPGVATPEVSGSIDVQLSGAQLPRVDAAPVVPSHEDSRPISSGKVTAAVHEDSRPVSSGRVVAVAGEPSGRSKRITDAAKDALDVGVSKLGSGLDTLGDGVSKLGEGVSKLGDFSRKVPVVGSSVSKIGEGITHVGASLHVLPRVARTRRGRLLIRSMIVGFVLVGAWIGVIVALQLHGNDTPDFRPNAESILVDLSKGSIDEIYEQASPRFQEMVRKERFIDDMTDLAETVGKFREIAAVNDSLVTTGPTGRIGRVSVTAAYEKATCKVSVSLHYDQDRWKLLGLGIELPNELKISQAQREERVKACKDPMDLKHCDVHQAADAILSQLKDGHADRVWDDASPVFQKQEQKIKFIQLQLEHLVALGSYRRIIAVSEAKVIGGTSATFDTLAEFDKASGVRTVFGFFRRSKLDPWRLRSFKIVLPMPRGAEDAAASPTAPEPQRPQPAPSPAPAHPAPRDAGAK